MGEEWWEDDVTVREGHPYYCEFPSRFMRVEDTGIESWGDNRDGFRYRQYIFLQILHFDHDESCYSYDLLEKSDTRGSDFI